MEMDRVEDWSVSEMLKLSLLRPIWTTVGFATPPFLFA
jgi:hypothetical protein